MSTQASPGALSHVDATGAAKMVDVSAKAETDRLARARGCITMQPETLNAIRLNQVAKGDVLSVARIAGIMAAKRTADLIPLCHPLPLTEVDVALHADDALPGIRVETTARTTWKTGVEMEALMAATVALLTVYDMAKAMDRGMVLGEVRLVEKSGGKSGHWQAR